MSGLVGAAESTGYLQMKDKRLVTNYQIVRRQRDRISERHSATAYPGGYISDYWPGGMGLGGDQAADVGVLSSVWSRTPSRLSHGCASRVGFVGVARDQYGAPLAGATCSLFRTATKEWIMDIVSGADGSFLLQSWYSPDTHFIVFSKTGPPDMFGTTKQSLVGA